MFLDVSSLGGGPAGRRLASGAGRAVWLQSVAGRCLLPAGGCYDLRTCAFQRCAARASELRSWFNSYCSRLKSNGLEIQNRIRTPIAFAWRGVLGCQVLAWLRAWHIEAADSGPQQRVSFHIGCTLEDWPLGRRGKSSAQVRSTFRFHVNLPECTIVSLADSIRLMPSQLLILSGEAVEVPQATVNKGDPIESTMVNMGKYS